MKQLLLAAALLLSAPVAAQQVTWDPTAKGKTVYAYSCTGLLAGGFNYNCHKIEYILDGPYSDNYHFIGNGGTIVTYVVDHNSYQEYGEGIMGSVQGILLRQKLGDKPQPITAAGACTLSKAPLGTKLSCFARKPGAQGNISVHNAIWNPEAQ